MTKQDYIIVAEVLNRVRGMYWVSKAGRYNAIVEELAAAFAEDNPRFNQDKFIDACGLEEEGYERHEHSATVYQKRAEREARRQRLADRQGE
jgi:hypothetical protein